MKVKGMDARSLLVGLAAGAGAILAGNSYFNRHPDRRITQQLVNRALNRKYNELAKSGPIRLGREFKYVIFSDHHKGALNLADNFRQCKDTYLSALDYYYEQGYTLIILGDAEELQEEPVDAVMGSYGDVFQQEARFHPDRLVRVYGNHDSSWQAAETVERFMAPFFPGITYREGLLFQVLDGDGEHADVAGEIFLVHGNQGTIDSDVFGFIAPILLPYYREFQNKTGFGATSPSQDACLRSMIDNRLYRWVSKKRRLILIAGHTHRPVWSSKTHLDKLIEELYALLRLDPDQHPQDYEDQVARKKAEIEERQAKFPPCEDIVKTRPAYFNAGCCRYDDGDITGIEMHDGQMRLVKWGRQAGKMKRTILEENEIKEFFLYL